MTTYDGPFRPLPDAVRAQHPNMFGWEFVKAHPSRDRWIPVGYVVYDSDGARSYTLDGMCVRDRVLYA